MDTPRVALIIFLLIFLFATPDTQRTTPSQQLQLAHLVREENHNLNILEALRYGDLDVGDDKWINATGLRKEDGYAWDILPGVRTRAARQSAAVVQASKASWEGRELHPVRVGGPPSNRSWSPSSVPFYHNITGIVRGRWVRSSIAKGGVPPALNLTRLSPGLQYITQEYNRNISGYEGDLRIKLDEKKSVELVSEDGFVRELRADLTIKDETSSGDGWEMALHGVHYPDTGSVILSTSGEKFAGIFSLPLFAFDNRTFVLAQELLNATLRDTIRKQESSLYMSPTFPWSSSPNNPGDMIFPTPHCEYIVYLQVHSPQWKMADLVAQRTDMDGSSIDAKSALGGLETELRYPTGADMGEVPPLELSAVIFSPDCGFVLESKGPPDFAPQEGTHLRGLKLESYLLLIRRCIISFAFVLALQVSLLIRQMKDTSTPSTRSRVSFYTIAIMALGDGFVFMGFVIVSIFVDAAFLVLISTAFIAFLCVSFFGMKFLMDIWTIQAPERRERERRMASSTPTAPPLRETGNGSSAVISAAGADTLPLPATAQRGDNSGATPVILPPDQDTGATEAEDGATALAGAPQTPFESARREMGALYSRFYFLLLGLLFLSLHATSWPTTARSVYTNALAFVYLSLWTPQIHRNVMRNCRKALRWEFVVGQSLLRLVPVAYFYGVRDNILFVDTDPHAALALAGWLWLQIWALVSQEILGPRFFVPDGWAPPAYDYHPILREGGDEESGASNLPVGFSEATADNPDSPTAITASSSSSTTTSMSTTKSAGGDAAAGEPAKHRKGQKIFDCAICMQNIDVPIVPSAGSSGEAESPTAAVASNIFSRRVYMVTPCRHIFHSACLEGWMRYRLQCPICRENLPPL